MYSWNNLVHIGEDEFEGIQIVCNTLQINPFNFDDTIIWLANHNFRETVRWMEDNQESYFRGLTYGFLVYEDMSERPNPLDGVEIYPVTIL